AKPTLQGRLALVPSNDSFSFGSQAVHDPSMYELYLPSDDAFFRHLAMEHFKYPADDLRSSNPKSGFVELRVSDKGQNLRGVIAMFGNVGVAYEILTNKYWRTVLAQAKEETIRPLTFDWD